MPHVWEMGERLFDAESRTSDRPIWRVVLAGAWYSFRLALAGFAHRHRGRESAWPP